MEKKLNKINLSNFFRNADNIYLTKNFIVKQSVKDYVDKQSINHRTLTETYMQKNKRAL